MSSAEPGSDLRPVLTIHLGDGFFRAWNDIWRDKDWIGLPAETGSCWLWCRTRARRSCLLDRAWNDIWRDKDWIVLPTRTYSSGCLRGGWWFWRCTRTCSVRPLRFFRWRSICSFSGGTFPSWGRGWLLMRGVNMSVIGRAVVECFAARYTDKGVVGDAFVVRLEVTIKGGFLWKSFVASRAFEWFFPGVDSLVSFEISAKVLPQVSQRYSFRCFFAGVWP